MTTLKNENNKQIMISGVNEELSIPCSFIKSCDGYAVKRDGFFK